jgi:8-oxo-dGTP pyrophosphatase MutT (NUDIX family)
MNPTESRLQPMPGAPQESCIVALIRDDGKVLLLQRPLNDRTFSQGGGWCLPGGKFDLVPDEEDETRLRLEKPREAMEREAREETGLVPQHLHAAGNMVVESPDGRRDRIHGFISRRWTGSLRDDFPTDEHLIAEWLDQQEIERRIRSGEMELAGKGTLALLNYVFFDFQAPGVEPEGAGLG